VDDVHDGTFDDSAGADDSSGTFNDGETDLTTDKGSQSGSYNGGTINESGYDGTLAIDSANGSETDTNGAVSDNGSGNDNTDEVDGGSVSHQTPLGPNGSHSDSASVADTDLASADGPFTTCGGAIATEDIHYGSDDTSDSNDSSSDTTTSGNALGGTTTLSDSLNATDKNKEDDTGERDQTATSTTDDGTGTDTDHGTGSYSQQTNVTSPTTTASDGLTEGDISDDFTTDKYDVTGTGRTDDDTFDNEDRPSGTLTNTYNYTAPNDPGTNISSSETDKSNSDDKDDGTEDQTNGSITSETDNFTDTTDGTDDTTYNAASDVGAASGPVAPSVTSLSYPRLVIQLGLYGEGETIAAGYSGATSTTGTANAGADDGEHDLADGTITDTNGTVNTDENFDDDDKWKNSAGVTNTTTSVNAPPGNDYTGSYNATETGNGTDESDGTIDGGVTSDEYEDIGTETDTITSNSSFDTSSGGTTTHGTTSYVGTDKLDGNESGDYKTEPPGTQITPTPDNPGGYAVSDQTIDDDETMTSTRTQTYSGTINGPSYYVNGSGDYTAKEKLTANSDGTVDVNVAQNKDTQSGDYSANASESQIANYNDTGIFSSAHVYQTWTFQNHQEHSGYNNDGGNYGGQDSDTQGSTDSGTLAVTITVTVSNYTGQGGSDTKTTSYGGSSGGGSPASTTTGPAKKAPVDGSAGDAPEANGAVVMLPSFRFDGYPEEGVPFDAGKGPVSIVGIVGRDETPRGGQPGGLVGGGTPGAGIAADVDAVKNHIDKEGANGPDRLAAPVTLPGGRVVAPDMIYGSSNGINMPIDRRLGTSSGKATLPSTPAAQIAADQYSLITSAANQLKEGEVFRVVIIGFSWGGEKAMQVASLLAAMVKANPALAGKVQIHLRTLDPADPNGNPSKARPTPWSASSWHNWSQNKTPGAGDIDGAFNHDGNALPPVAGARGFGAKHRALPGAAAQELVESLWTP
jgi:hypothetical protein